MKKISFRLTALLAAMMVTMMSFAKTHDLEGKVIDSKGEPLPFVNVVLLSMPDSAFVQGAMTDEQGVYHIVTDINDGLLKVSSIGYQTKYININSDASSKGEGSDFTSMEKSPTDSKFLIIQLEEDSKMLSEVVVKGTLPKTHVKGDAMRTTVAGTILEKAGTVSDALKRIPSLEADREGSVKVLGRGDAEVYINGRRVQDLSELTRLRSDQIQHVDVVQNPGARYAAATKAVVRITLKKAQGEGFSFQDNAGAMYRYGHTLTNNLDVNYRTGGLDITASFWAGRYGHTKSLQENDLFFYVGTDRYTGYAHQETEYVWKGWSPQLQVNYMVDENHSFGAFYKYDRHPSGELSSLFKTDIYENGIFTESSESRIWQDERFYKHIFNAYYNGKLGQLGIDLNVDGLFDDTKSPGSTVETMTPMVTSEFPVTRSFESNTNSGNNFWASKLILSYPVWMGNLSLGGEYSYNHRTDAYSYIATDYVPVKATDTEINETSAAAFLEYGKLFGKVYVQAGMRYEHLKNDYFNFGVREDEVCRNYGDWFPTLVISAPIGKVQTSLSYRKDIQRPNYGNLTSSSIYINRYSYQSGNPYLKPTYTHNLVLNAAYQWANLTLNYSRIKDVVTMSTEPYPDSDDPMVNLIRPINSADGYNQFTINLSARPVIGCWHPMWYLYTIFQNYKTPTADGTILTLNHPYFIFGSQNDINLPKGFRLNAAIQWSSKGDYNNNRLTSQRFEADLGIQRDFNLRRMGSLTVDLRCDDIFNSNKTNAIIYGYRELTVRNPVRRTFAINLTWKFNEARSKYRGSGAGDKQKARM